MPKKETTLTSQLKKSQAKSQLQRKKTEGATATVCATPEASTQTLTDRVLVTEPGNYKRPDCRSGWLLLRAHARRPISELGEQWLRRWTIPGLDATACRCPKCGGVWYVDEQMIARMD